MNTAKTDMQRFSEIEWENETVKGIGSVFQTVVEIKRDDVSDEGLPCVRYGELYTRYQDYYFEDTASRIPPSIAAYSTTQFKKGDLLFAGYR